MTLIAWFSAALLEFLLGCPANWPHPVRWIGHLITWLERRIRRLSHSSSGLQIGGAVLWLVVVGSAWLVSWGVLCLANAIHPVLGFLIEVWMIYTVLAARCLSDAAKEVYRVLKQGSLSESRQALSWIVGRDTSQLERPQMTRAVVETVAENSVDGVIAPLFFLLLGGAPLAMAYKAVNTLDSMVGYKTEKYRDIGRVSARLDDAANYIPARLGWLLLTLAAWLLRENAAQALKIGFRDRHQHSSPNCAWPEGAVAGALGIRLGGPNDYFGERVEKPWIGDAQREVEVEDITRTINLMLLASFLALVLFAGLRLIVTGG